MDILNEIQRLKEGDLRIQIVIPLLHALGCHHIKDNHATKPITIKNLLWLFLIKIC